MTDKEILEEIEYNVLNDPFTTFNQDSSYESVQIKATAIEELVKRFKKQQKEIEDLKDKNKTLEQLLQGNLYEMYKYYRELANSYQANCISKDKIKEKIDLIDKEYAELIEKNKNDLYLVNINAQRHNAMQTILGE